MLDVFSSDEQAERWYATVPVTSDLLLDRNGMAAAFRSIVASSAMVPIETVGTGRAAAMPSVGGMMPKALARFDPATGQLFLDLGGGVATGKPGLPVVAKIEATGYEGIIELEALAYKAAASAKLPVPRLWTLNPPEFRPMLVVERVDLDTNGAALPMETMYSVLFEATGGKVTTADAATYEMVAAVLGHPQAFRIDRAASRQQLFKQVLLSLLTGNGDLHMRNLALLGTRDDARLSSVYDPAPMRAWPEHDIVSACNLGGLDLDRTVPPPEIGDALLRFATASCGLTLSKTVDAFELCLAAGQQFFEDVRASDVADQRKAALLRSVGKLRAIIEKAVPPRRGRRQSSSSG